MFEKVIFLVLVLITLETITISLAKKPSKPKPKNYEDYYPEDRKGNKTRIPKPVRKPSTAGTSGLGVGSGFTMDDDDRESIVFPPLGIEFPEFPESEASDSGLGIEFPESRVGDKKRKKAPKVPKRKKIIRVSRQTDDYEHPDCAKCLDDKYFKHYLAKGCKPIDANLYCKKPCPKYFDCPKVQTKPSIQGCEFNNQTYNVGDFILTSDVCIHCICSKLNDNEPKINCAVSECFSDWSHKPLNNSCYKYYKEEDCCSSTKCLTDQEMNDMKTCLYNEKNYKIGERIYPKEDKCVTCVCGENWNLTDPLNSPTCKKIDCNFELENKWKHREGCVPIYHESHCCPIDYHCPLPKEWKCMFGGKDYDIGEKLVTKNQCLDCTCRVPPEFTCIQQKCDPMPTDSNCIPIYESDKCCPTYNCQIKEANNRANKMVLSNKISVIKELDNQEFNKSETVSPIITTTEMPIIQKQNDSSLVIPSLNVTNQTIIMTTTPQSESNITVIEEKNNSTMNMK